MLSRVIDFRINEILQSLSSQHRDSILHTHDSQVYTIVLKFFCQCIKKSENKSIENGWDCVTLQMQCVEKSLT